jgi:hypothetical protein
VRAHLLAYARPLGRHDANGNTWVWTECGQEVHALQVDVLPPVECAACTAADEGIVALVAEPKPRLRTPAWLGRRRRR